MAAAPDHLDGARAVRADDHRLPPPVVAGTAALAQVALAKRARGTPASRAAAAVLGGGALSLIGASAATLHRERTTVSPHHLSAATALVRTGPFGRSRNPIYLGIAGLLLAHAVGRRSWPAVLPAALFVVVMERTQIRAEEVALRVLFGAEYEGYCREVPRWSVGPVATVGLIRGASCQYARESWPVPQVGMPANRGCVRRPS